MNAREKRIQERQQAANETGSVRRLPVVVDGVHFTRPATRADCLPGGSNAARPCPWASCVHHLAIDVNAQTGRILEHGEPESMTHTCVLDVAEKPLSHHEPGTEQRDALGHHHENTLYAIGAVMGITRERVRQIEAKALRRLVAPSRRAIDEPDRPVLHTRNMGSIRATCEKCHALPVAQVHPETPVEQRTWCYTCRRRKADLERSAKWKAAKRASEWAARRAQ